MFQSLGWQNISVTNITIDVLSPHCWIIMVLRILMDAPKNSFFPVTTHIKAIGKVIRAMENSLHWVLDVTMNEYGPLPAAPSKC